MILRMSLVAVTWMGAFMTDAVSADSRMPDWLVTPVDTPVTAAVTASGKELFLSNGLIQRIFRLQLNAATIAYDNLMTGESMLRGVKPEAAVVIDGREFHVGGLTGQIEYAYLRPEWIDSFTADPNAFQFVDYEVGKTEARFAWNRKRYSEALPWPPKGVSLKLRFQPPTNQLPGVTLAICYEMYEGIPLLAKWLEIRNDGSKAVRLNKLTSEILAVVEYESQVEQPPRWEYPNIHVESDYAFGGDCPANATETVYWAPDPQYQTQVNYLRKTPVLLECRPPLGPDVLIEPGQTFQSFRTFELVHDSTDRERKTLAVRRMYRTLAPWVTENPILMHVRNADPQSVKTAVDQCAEVGFEMIIMTFGSGIDLENTDPAYMGQIKGLVDYAHSKGIELGGYSLLASRRISDKDDVINPKTGKTGGAIFGESPCLCSEWGREYFRRLRTFVEHTGIDIIEHDGSYPGDVCASTSHPGHSGLDDSQWRQRQVIADFYHWCRERGVYLNVPDWYFLTGSNKSGMGYREVNWSLPRERQIILGRQNIYDGTWWKSPSMGWMFVPLTEYQGGGAAATLEPLSEHLDMYEAHLAQNFTSGVQACYRGPRLYDTDATRAVVRKWVDFYKAHRAILDSDVIHVRRPDGRDIDCLLHVNPRLRTRGLAVVHNPCDYEVTRELRLPLYYTGLRDVAMIRERDGQSVRYELDRAYNVTVPVRVPAHGMTWLFIE
ncbi:MAG: alpha-galactosidase [Solirubrobacterales bacterium]